MLKARSVNTGMRENPRSPMRRTASSGVALSGSAATSTSGTITSRTAVSPRSKILSIISASETVTSASSGSIWSRSLSSSRDTNCRVLVRCRPRRRRAPLTIALVAQVSGERALLASSKTWNRLRMSAVDHSRATAFGMTSPNTRRSGVRKSVTATAAMLPSTGIRAQVATADAMMCASVTPIIAVDRSRSGCLNDSR